MKRGINLKSIILGLILLNLLFLLINSNQTTLVLTSKSFLFHNPELSTINRVYKISAEGISIDGDDNLIFYLSPSILLEIEYIEVAE